MDIGAFISAIIYFVIFMAIIYFVIVVPYKHIQARRGQVVFGDPAPVKTCPACLSTTCRPPRPSASTAAPTSPSPPEKEWHRTGRALVTGQLRRVPDLRGFVRHVRLWAGFAQL